MWYLFLLASNVVAFPQNNPQQWPQQPGPPYLPQPGMPQPGMPQPWPIQPGQPRPIPLQPGTINVPPINVQPWPIQPGQPRPVNIQPVRPQPWVIGPGQPRPIDPTIQLVRPRIPQPEIGVQPMGIRPRPPANIIDAGKQVAHSVVALPSEALAAHMALDKAILKTPLSILPDFFGLKTLANKVIDAGVDITHAAPMALVGMGQKVADSVIDAVRK